MTFQTGVWAVDGNQTSAQIGRLQLQAATLGSQGVVGPLDCQVQATSPTPTAGIIITPGGVVILGAEASYQGSYQAWNIGNDTTLTIAATGGTPRSDMIVARAEDPTWQGSPWGNPAAGQIVFPRVLSNVGAGATVVPAGTSAIPLARIDMPAGVSVVQQSYIIDLRAVANPQQSMQLYQVAGPATAVNSTVSTTVAAQWPPGASWQVPVPSYATKMIAEWWVSSVTQNGEGDGWARGSVWIVIGSSISAPAVTTPQTLVSIAAAQAPGKHSFSGGGTVAIPASIRGTTQTIQFAQIATSHNATMGFGEGSSAAVLLRFSGTASAA